jgi:adenine deaminase
MGRAFPVIECFDGQLITARRELTLPVAGGHLQSDPSQDILKLVVLNRYTPGAAPAVAFIKGFGLKEGALASSVGHDSHNITAVGCDDASLARAINLVVRAQGGLAAVGDMRPATGNGSTCSALDEFAKAALGSGLQAPFMTLSFMALLVIPSLKLSDKGLFDGEKFEFVAVSQ